MVEKSETYLEIKDYLMKFKEITDKINNLKNKITKVEDISKEIKLNKYDYEIIEYYDETLNLKIISYLFVINTLVRSDKNNYKKVFDDYVNENPIEYLYFIDKLELDKRK